MRGRQEGRKGGCGYGTHRNMHLSVCPLVSPTMLGHNGQFKMICIIVIFKCNSHLQPIKLLEFLWRYKGVRGIRKAWIMSILWGSTTKIIRESFCGFVIMEAFFLSKSHESSENIFHISLSICGFEGLLCYMEFRVHPQHWLAHQNKKYPFYLHNKQKLMQCAWEDSDTHTKRNPQNKTVKPLTCCDGLFIVAPRHLLPKIHFQSKHYQYTAGKSGDRKWEVNLTYLQE